MGGVGEGWSDGGTAGGEGGELWLTRNSTCVEVTDSGCMPSGQLLLDRYLRQR